ncbi:MAG: hypothetical protein AB1942_13550 [Pseudomonadota bacterium]
MANLMARQRRQDSTAEHAENAEALASTLAFFLPRPSAFSALQLTAPAARGAAHV